MDKPDHDPIEQFRTLVRNVLVSKPTAPGPGDTPLLDTARLARLRAIVDNPYHKLVFGGMSPIDLMRLCAQGMMGNGDFLGAARVFKQIALAEMGKQGRARKPKSTPGSPDHPSS